MDATEKKQICKLVAQAILSDGQITDDERRFLDNLMERYQLSEPEKSAVLQINIDDDPAQLVSNITSFSSRIDLMTELVMAVAADNVLSKTEQQLLETVASAIGVEQTDMDMLVKNAMM